MLYIVILQILVDTVIACWINPIAVFIQDDAEINDMILIDNNVGIALMELFLVEIIFTMTWQSLKWWRDFEIIQAKGLEPAEEKAELERAQQNLKCQSKFAYTSFLLINLTLGIGSCICISEAYASEDKSDNLLPIWIEIIVEAFSALWLIGYFVLCFLAYYWFRVKYANKQTEVKKVLFLLCVLCI